MLYGLYLSAAGMQAQEARQNVMSNNLANAQTNGFKRDLAVMRTRANAGDEDPRMAMYRLPVLKDQGGGVFAVSGGIDLTQGTFQKTSQATDLALDGRGFFTVQGDEKGQRLLTRDGKFILSNDGTLITANGGRPVLSSDGQPITLNPTLPIMVDSTGKISQGDAGTQLGLADVTDSRQIRKLGGNVMTVNRPEAMTAISPETQVRQATLENSGVDPVTEMINMMEGQRAFEANAKMITYQDQTLSQLNTIGRVA